jgi:hypothetical protein
METLISTIKSTFESITEIKEVYAYPLSGNPKKYPAIIFFPTSMDNSFETQADNFKVYNFSVFLTVSVSGSSIENVYETILPKIHDKVISKIDTDWNFGTIDGNRVWARLSTSALTLSNEQSGATANAEMTLQVKLLTNN